MFTVNPIHSEHPLSELPAEDYVVLSDRRSVLMAAGGHALPTVSQVSPMLSPEDILLHCGSLDGRSCWGGSHSLEGVPAGLSLMECRTAFLQPELDIMNAISRSRELTAWRRAHRRCGNCGAENEFSRTDLALVCPSCGQRYYPQIAPAVIVAITRDNGREMLLAHNRNFAGATFSIIAGFVEAGETLEQAVSREVLEETGINVKNIRYLSSQPWPFPNSLMLGFSAEYASGEARPDGEELSELGWFSRENLPDIPKPGSIAHKIISEHFNLP